MPAAISITRQDYTAAELRSEAKRTDDADAARRMLALALVLEGKSRGEAAKSCGMDLQILCDWVHRYNAEGIAGLFNRPLPGRSPKLTEGQMAALKAIVLRGPNLAVDRVDRWRIVDLCRVVEDRWGVTYSETGMLRLLWSLDLSHRKTRPVHPQTDAKAQQAFKKGGSPRAWARS